MINEAILVTGLGLSEAHIKAILAKLPNGTAYQLQHYPKELFLAGGAIRAILNNEVINDVDLFAASEASASGAANFFKCGNTTEQLFVTANAYTVKDVTPHVQIVRREFYSTAKAVLDSFDFSVCKAALWWDDGWKSLTDVQFFDDLEQQKLTYCSPAGQDPRDSLLRTLKFHARGYTIDARSLARIVVQTVQKIDNRFISSQNLEDSLAADFGGTEDRVKQSRKIRVSGSAR